MKRPAAKVQQVVLKKPAGNVAAGKGRDRGVALYVAAYHDLETEKPRIRVLGVWRDLDQAKAAARSLFHSRFPGVKTSEEKYNKHNGVFHLQALPKYEGGNTGCGDEADEKVIRVTRHAGLQSKTVSVVLNEPSTVGWESMMLGVEAAVAPNDAAAAVQAAFDSALMGPKDLEKSCQVSSIEVRAADLFAGVSSGRVRRPRCGWSGNRSPVFGSDQLLKRATPNMKASEDTDLSPPAWAKVQDEEGNLVLRMRSYQADDEFNPELEILVWSEAHQVQ